MIYSDLLRTHRYLSELDAEALAAGESGKPLDPILSRLELPARERHIAGSRLVTSWAHGVRPARKATT